MAVAGLLLYSSWQQLSSPNRRVLCIIGFVLGCTAELCAIIGLIGLARFSDTEKIPFKLGYWLNLVQLWAYAGYIGFLLFLWFAPLRSPSPYPLPLTLPLSTLCVCVCGGGLGTETTLPALWL